MAPSLDLAFMIMYCILSTFAIGESVWVHCAASCRSNCSTTRCGEGCCELIERSHRPLWRRNELFRRRQLSNIAQNHTQLLAERRRASSVSKTKSQMRADGNASLARRRLLPFKKLFQVHRAPLALRRNRTYHKHMHAAHRTNHQWHSAASTNATSVLKEEQQLDVLCTLNASSPEKLLAYAKHVATDFRAQLSEQGLRPGGCRTCLFSSLTDGADSQFVIGHQTFMDSLLKLHPDVRVPMVIMELGYNGTEGSGLLQQTRDALREQYAFTVFLKPYVCPEAPFQWPLVRFANGATATNSFSKEAAAAFYRRLQLFTLINCDSIVAFDTSDMLILRPIPHLLSPARVLNGTDFAAAERCDSRLEEQGNSQYFNAGLFLVGKRHLNAETYASLLSVAISPRRPSTFEPKRWAADQDVLNAYFDPLRGGQDRTVLGYFDNYAKRYANPLHPRYSHCRPPTAARIIHFLGTKPWVAPSMRQPTDLQPYIVDIEKFWLASYFRGKTIVVGGGPSVQAPAGTYIDMFRRVIRINDYRIVDASTTGLKTTDVIIHKATKRGNFSSFSRRHILLADFGENATTLSARMSQPSGSGLRLNQVTRLPPYYNSRLKQEMALAAGVPYLDAVAQAHEPYHPLSGTIALEYALQTTTKRPVYFIGCDMMLGANYSHGVQQSASAVSRNSLSKWHRIHYDRALLHKREAVEKSLRRLDVPVISSQYLSP